MQILVQIKAVTTFQLIDGLHMNSCALLVCKGYGEYPTQWECVCVVLPPSIPTMQLRERTEALH